jgi:ribosomal protein L7/L12
MKVTIEINDKVVDEEGLKQVLEDVVHHISSLHQSHGLKRATSEWYDYEIEGLAVVVPILELKIQREFSKKIKAIKAVKDYFKLGLKDSKDLVDQAEDSGKVVLPAISQVKLNQFNLTLDAEGTGYRAEIQI